ncbi:Na+/H+ antiporter subunit E [Falsirhodobacter algicola]|uniref:Na+/H+ antiporter subunit E n=1 Tax=Falsirhodobacter algicola TaxID=2692330 RepID=A0A8J8SKF4_9RHOB|nr:Na+/H+ antiporter subunit E [Falsirhodobacter algicola]QUS35337.1 Na+/H+ antiporter subunit E [Falsirhodobacter algicola]
MKQILPHPLAAAGLLLMWLMLTSFSLGQLVLGTGVALVAARAVAPLEPQAIRIRNWRPLPMLFVVIVYDILWSNLQVGRQVFRRAAPRSGLVEVALDTRNRAALAILAVVITATPGTAWMGWDPRRGILLMHVLDIGEGETWEHTIQNRYERRLLEIFG